VNVEKLARLFWDFASTAEIPSKDEGLIPFKPYGTQRYLLSEILSALAEGIHNIIIVKPRQVGATTLMLLWDAFWLLKNDGLTGQFVADSDGNKTINRHLLNDIIRTLPVKYSRAVRVNNRALMSWAHGSRFMFQTAGTRFAKRTGRSRGLNYLHATEVAYWEDQDAITALQNSLSERHPLSLYIWESTANGYNHFYDMYQDGLHAVTTRVIFVPWWRHELYSTLALDEPARTKVFQVYWDGTLSPDEHSWQREITRRWGVTLTPHQWAWWRWRLAEKGGKRHDALLRMHEDFPTLPEHAFQASGGEFLGHTVMARLREEVGSAPAPEYYHYTFGPLIEETGLYETEAPLAQLKVWEQPNAYSYYIVAADPAFGASEKSDRSVCQVWRATMKDLTQVAEFVSTNVTMQQFAWVTMHLAGTFTPSAFILELNGPGYGVLQEIQRLQAWGWGTQRPAAIEQALQGIQHYLYRRNDSFAQGAFLQWKSTPAIKTWAFSRLRDYFLTGLIHPTSALLVEELGSIRQDGDKFGAVGKQHDDTVATAAMAVEVWQSQVVPLLHTLPPRGPSPETPLAEPPPAHERLMGRFFNRLLAVR